MFLILFFYKATLFFTGLTEAQQNTIDFLNNDKEELKLNYTASELSHLEDVKRVMKFVDVLFYTLLLTLTLIITYYKNQKEQLRKLFLYGGKTTIIVLAVFLLYTLLNFNDAFTLFHKIFFPQGNWMFAEDSLLIQTFPIEFFVGISRIIFAGTLGGGILFILLSLYLKKFKMEI